MTPPDGSGDAALRALIAQLSPEERAELTSGASGWSTLPAEAVGLSPMILGDGPLGLVSATFDERDTALLLPCGTALGATWDPEVVRAVAAVQGSEAARRGYAGVYAPNLNLARTGLSGRTFEMYSEDPLLTGTLGAAFVAGLQGQGVAACPKHLVANDTETQRQQMSATVDEATLREVYLYPFEAALLDGGAWMVMGAYNRLNGIPCTAHPTLLKILKDEWRWDGVTVSDYFALKDTLGPALAGLDLEMPGPAIHLGPHLGEAVARGEVPQERVDDAVSRLLRLADRVGALDGSARQATHPEEHVEPEDAPSVLAAAAAASFVLVQNNGDLLPLKPDQISRLAVIGPNADRPTFQGATFGRVRPSSAVVTPRLALERTFEATTQVVYEAGTVRVRPEPLGSFAVTTPDGTRGVLLEHFREDPSPVLAEVRQDSSFVWFGSVPGAGPTTEAGRLRLRCVFTPQASGSHVFGAGGSGETTLSVDGAQVTHRPAPAASDVMGQVARAEMTTAAVHLEAGKPVTLEVDMSTAGARVQALTVGCLPPQPPNALERAVEAAADADAVVLVVGDVLETSRESRDLDTSALPPEQLELIGAVAAVNPRTVVVLNAGRPVDAPWADDVAAVMYAWLPGQEFGPALASVLAGQAEPAGRMPVTVTMRDEDRSTWGERLDDDLALDYSAVEPTGYRHLQRNEITPRFAFGEGLGYTQWQHANTRVDLTEGQDPAVVVTVTVTNVGRRAGREVVQVYLRAPSERDARLAGFAGVELEPGESADVVVRIAERGLSRWDRDAATWAVAPGAYQVLVGRSSTEVHHVTEVEM